MFSTSQLLAEHHPHDHGEAGNTKGMTAAHILQRDAHRYEIKMMIGIVLS